MVSRNQNDGAIWSRKNFDGIQQGCTDNAVNAPIPIIGRLSVHPQYLAIQPYTSVTDRRTPANGQYRAHAQCRDKNLQYLSTAGVNLLQQTTHKTELYTFCHHIQLRMTESALQNKYDHVNNMNESVTCRKSCQKTGNLLTQQKHLGLTIFG